MSQIIKTLLLFLILAIALPLAFPEKFLHWLPPYGPDQNNLPQIAGAKLARFGLPYSPTNPIPPNTAANIDATPPIVTQETKILPEVAKTPDNVPLENKEAPQKPYRILIIGDSFIAVPGSFGQILEENLSGYDQATVIRKGKVSSGLSRPDYYDWIKESKKIAQETHPNIVIIMMGTNDAQGFYIEQNGKSSLAAFNTDLWKKEYLNRAARLIEVFNQINARVYWIGLPEMRQPGYNSKIKILSEIQMLACQDRSGAKFIPAADLVDNGRYQPFVADPQGVMRATRNADGIHLSYFGGTLLVNKIIALLKTELDLIPKMQNPQ